VPSFSRWQSSEQPPPRQLTPTTLELLWALSFTPHLLHQHGQDGL
jgi:hypothetical protein